MHAFARVTVCVCVWGGGGGVGAIKQGGGAIKRGGGGHLPQMPPLWGRHWAWLYLHPFLYHDMLLTCQTNNILISFINGFLL